MTKAASAPAITAIPAYNGTFDFFVGVASGVAVATSCGPSTGSGTTLFVSGATTVSLVALVPAGSAAVLT